MASVADMAASADIDRLLSEHGIAAGAVALARMEIERLPLRPYGADPQRMREYDRVLTFAHDRLYSAVADLQAIEEAIRARCATPDPDLTRPAFTRDETEMVRQAIDSAATRAIALARSNPEYGDRVAHDVAALAGARSALLDAMDARDMAPAPDPIIHTVAGILEGPCPDACEHGPAYVESVHLACTDRSCQICYRHRGPRAR